MNFDIKKALMHFIATNKNVFVITISSDHSWNKIINYN